MPKRRSAPDLDTRPLFPEVPQRELEKLPQIRPLTNPVWTENKAKLIERYLFYFLLVTKHGTYIDGFAGPQNASKPESWAAKLMLENNSAATRRKPGFRHFYLFDKGSNTTLWKS